MARNIKLFENLQVDKAVRLILEGTAADVGERFFDSLVENLTRVLNTTGAWITEYIENGKRLDSLAFFWDGRRLGNFAYDISGTACEKVINEKRLVHIPNRLLELYKGNPEIAELEDRMKRKGAVSYLGVPLIDSRERILGHLSVVDVRPIPDHPQVINIFRIFAHRASAELQRLRAEKATAQREEKLRKLFDSTMDAIIEIDKDLRITRINLSGERLFKASASSLIGRSLAGILVKTDYEKILNLLETLRNMPKDQPNLWAPGALQVKAVDGEILPAEGSFPDLNWMRKTISHCFSEMKRRGLRQKGELHRFHQKHNIYGRKYRPYGTKSSETANP